MNLAAITFLQPLVLFGLIALPVIWWLLRLTPPRPQIETFPPLRILARVLRPEETPHKSPWWLTLLRLLLAAIIILALADPVYNPNRSVRLSSSALALIVDNSWATASDWDRRVATAERLIAEAGETSEPVILAFTSERPNTEIGPFDATAALDRLRAASPLPIPSDRPAIFKRVAEILGSFQKPTLALLTDGLAAESDEPAFAELLDTAPGSIIWIEPERLDERAIISTENEADAMIVNLVRGPDPAPRQVSVWAHDDKGRQIAEATAIFEPGATETVAEIRVPFELRNDFNRITVEGEHQAAAVWLLDENARRRRVGLISTAEADQSQPLLSPLYYIRRALQPFADLVEHPTPDLAEAIPALIAQKPAIIIMADVGILPEQARSQMIEWINGGGTLLRFAGSRLSAAGNDQELLPVRLRTGERAMGGTLSWTEPQTVADFPEQGPFFDLPRPRDVLVRRQVLAEPTPDMVDRTWAMLADGTPLVTGAERGEGTIVLFHVTPEATWSDLPISGTFVEMLRRVVHLSRNQGNIDRNPDGKPASLAPLRMISSSGLMTPPPADARPLLLDSVVMPVTIDNPPGFYGTGDGVVAHNLLNGQSRLDPLARPDTNVPVMEMRYSFDESYDLKGILFAVAALLFVLDTLAVFWIGGFFTRRARSSGIVTLLAAFFILSGSTFSDAQTNDSKPGDTEAMSAIELTRIAYVLTGNASIDSVSRAGLAGLNRFLVEKTALEPGEPAGIDIAEAELAFYPLIYWPVDPDVPVPDEATMARVDAYMQQGGTVLFDTRDQYASDFGASSATPATLHLREILANLNIPPLEPVPPDHVLTKSFYILRSFPGRYADAPLWVAASLDAENTEGRPVRTGDGVSPILITAADFAGAWAIDASGNPLYPTVPANPMQRVYAFRTGVNIMMYMLTGNYKSDQVHLPILLERLGQ